VLFRSVRLKRYRKEGEHYFSYHLLDASLTMVKSRRSSTTNVRASTIIREHTAEIHRPHHPLGNDHWPTLYQETSDMLQMSIFCYWAGDVRKLIKDGQLTDEQIVKALCQFPTELQDLSEALSKTLELLANRKTNPGYDLYASMLTEVSEQFRRLVEATGNNRVFELLHVEDQVAGKFGGPVYVNSINHATKRITIGFRGSVTTKDFLCDWKTALAKIANPLAGEQRSGGDFIHVHHGFKEYLYDPVVETENEEGVLEKQPLIAHMLSRVAKLFEEYPDYHLYTTGHSLGGALATLFAMEAGASKDPRIKKPVTCITFASPRVGNLSFGRVFKNLEKSRRVRCFRVVNDDDLIPEIPATANMSCMYISCLPNKIYRHVGLTSHLHRERTALITYPRHYNHPVRLFFSDCGVLFKNIFTAVVYAPFVCTCQTSYAANHGCQEYSSRLKKAESALKAIYLNEQYGEQRKVILINDLSEAGGRSLPF